MAGKKGSRRTPTQRLKDRSQALKLHLEGRSNVEIARMLEVTEATIRKDIKAVEADWQRANNDLITDHRTRENAKLLNLESEYWSLYHESKKVTRKTTVKKVVPAFDLPDDDDRHEYDDLLDEIQAKIENLPESQSSRALLSEVIEVVESRLPEIRCLDGVRNCIKDRCVLWGLPIPIPKDTQEVDDEENESGVEDVARDVMEILSLGIQRKAETKNAS